MKLSLLTAFSCLLAVPAMAQNNWDWTATTPTDWNDASAWAVNAGAPDNDRFVNNGGTAVISPGGSSIAPIRDIKIGAGRDGAGAPRSGTVNNAAGVHAANGWAFIGLDGGNGNYNLADTTTTGGQYTGFGMGSGSITAGRLYVGLGGGGNGVLNVNTSASMSFGEFRVGEGSNGTLNIDNGSISGAGEIWIGNGAGNTGIVRQSGGTVDSANWLAIGRDNATGHYTLSGGTLRHSGANNTIIGSIGGTGTLEQTGGNFSESNDLRLGENATGNGKYNLKGGTATVNSWTLVGWTGGGTGELNVGGGPTTATFTSGYVEIGGGAGGAGNGTLNLLTNGVVVSRVIARNTASLSAQVNFAGGTFQARETNAEFLPNLSNANTELLAGGLIVDTAGFDIATSVGFDGVGGLTKNGLGVLTLSSPSTYTGKTIINTGSIKLLPGASLSASSEVVLATSASLDGGGSSISIPATQTLKGTGTVIADVTVMGKLAPGNSIGEIDITGNLTLTSTSTAEMEFDGGAAPNADLADASGTVLYAGTLKLINLGVAPLKGTTFKFFDGTSYSGVFSTKDLPSYEASDYWQDDLLVNGSMTYIPEPSATALLGLGLLSVIGRRRRR